MPKQLELPRIIHRCMWCRRPLYRKDSIAKRMGPRCERMDAALEKLYHEARGAKIPVCEAVPQTSKTM